MNDPVKPAESVRSTEPSKLTDPSQPPKGGFGAFADVYRARWAANHPQMQRTLPAVAAPEPASSADASRTRPAATDGTRGRHPRRWS